MSTTLALLRETDRAREKRIETQAREKYLFAVGKLVMALITLTLLKLKYLIFLRSEVNKS